MDLPQPSPHSSAIRVCPVPPPRRGEVLTFLHSAAVLFERPENASIVVDNACSGEQPSPMLWEALCGDNLVGAIAAHLQPGATALVEYPRVVSSVGSAATVALLRAAVDDLPRRGVRLAQALAEREATDEIAAFRAAGFAYAADLAYLVSTTEDFPTEAPESPPAFLDYAESEASRMAELIERTYAGSLDCPQLNGVRSMPEVLAGHRAAGRFAAERWFFVRDAEQDVGCLLLTDHPAADSSQDAQFELVYMGLIPEARGRGWGRVLVRRAQWQTRQAGRTRLVLAVDAANRPALRTYTECGLIPWATRAVLLMRFP